LRGGKAHADKLTPEQGQGDFLQGCQGQVGEEFKGLTAEDAFQFLKHF
jgi:hypothetical protein